MLITAQTIVAPASATKNGTSRFEQEQRAGVGADPHDGGLRDREDADDADQQVGRQRRDGEDLREDDVAQQERHAGSITPDG